MNGLSDLLLTGLLSYGGPLFGAILFVAAMGAPLPATVLVIATGAFTRLGMLNGLGILVWGLVFVVLGDVVSFGLGRFASKWVEQRWGGSPRWLRAQTNFARNGGMAIYMTRWLITVIAAPTNMVAGGSGFKFSRFLFYSFTGESTWLLLYGGLGYLAGSQWEAVNEAASDFSGLTLGAVILAVGLYYGIRSWRTQVKRKKEARVLLFDEED